MPATWKAPVDCRSGPAQQLSLLDRCLTGPQNNMGPGSIQIRVKIVPKTPITIYLTTLTWNQLEWSLQSRQSRQAIQPSMSLLPAGRLLDALLMLQGLQQCPRAHPVPNLAASCHRQQIQQPRTAVATAAAAVEARQSAMSNGKDSAMQSVFPEALTPLQAADPEVFGIIQDEKKRQWCGPAGSILLTLPAVLQTPGSSLHTAALEELHACCREFVLHM